MPTIDEMRGVGPEEVEAQKEKNNKEEFERVTGEANPDDQPEKSEEETQPTEDVKEKSKQVFSEGEEPTEDATQEQEPDLDDQERNIKVLKNSFDIDYEALPEGEREKFLNMAKSYRSAQGKFTEATQQLSEKEQKLQKHQQTLENLNGFLEQNPDIYKMIQKRQENPNAEIEEPQGQPKNPASQGQLNEDQLAEAGYLNKSELQGMDELARRRKVMQAELDYLEDQKVQSYKQKLQEADQEVQQQRQQRKVQQINKQRKDDGIDRFVSDYGVDLSKLDKETINAVSRRATRILDPSDDKGRLIDEDAFYMALEKELAVRGELPDTQPQPQPQQTGGLQNTGKSVNKRSGQRTPQSVTDLMEQKEKEQKSSLRNTHPRVASSN